MAKGAINEEFTVSDRIWLGIGEILQNGYEVNE